MSDPDDTQPDEGISAENLAAWYAKIRETSERLREARKKEEEDARDDA